jgi:hypothetical protein
MNMTMKPATTPADKAFAASMKTNGVGRQSLSSDNRTTNDCGKS